MLSDNVEKQKELEATDIVRCQTAEGLWPRWKLRIPKPDTSDFTLVVRLDTGNKQVFDYLLLPNHAFNGRSLSLTEDNGYEVDEFRHVSLEPILDLLSAVDISSVAR
jgi:hypothetical protein